ASSAPKPPPGRAPAAPKSSSRSSSRRSQARCPAASARREAVRWASFRPTGQKWCAAGPVRRARPASSRRPARPVHLPAPRPHRAGARPTPARAAGRVPGPSHRLPRSELGGRPSSGAGAPARHPPRENPDGIYCPWSPAHRRPPSPTVPGVPVHPLMPADPEAIGPYRLLARLGEGGMGRVYLGISRSGRLLAVKAVRSELAADPDFRTRFAREVDAARLVSGVFSAPLVDADTGAETPWMATGFVAGGSLREVVERTGPLPAEAAAVLAVGLAEALRAVHSAGLV